MSRTLYLEGATGISGDMTVAALLALGGSHEKLEAALASLRLEGFHHHISTRSSYGIAGTDFDVHLHEHDHDHEHAHGHEHHHHEHRNLADVEAVIARGDLTPRAAALARRIFAIVAEAEAKAHGVPVAEVHFHEVGAIDSIVDIVAAAVLVDDLDIDECIVTALSEGHGTIRCQHGDLPVPVPAVLNIAAAYGIPLRPTDVPTELVTPTGIAIAAALRTRDALPPEFRVLKCGCGLGKRDIGRPNVLRAMFLEETPAPEAQVYVVETNVDDATGQMLGAAMDALFAAGARDVHFIPCQMKKNRPGVMLRCIVAAPELAAVEKAVFLNTTTIGVRHYPVERRCLDRTVRTVETPYGPVQIKESTGDGILRRQPEYESVRALAERIGRPFAELLAELQTIIH